jgi:acid phosphatase (class A)
MRLLSRVRLDMRAATYPAKLHYKRERPFVAYGTRACNREDEQNVRDDGSYPSARATVGWAYALVLAQLNPERSDEILQRGREFGHSRIICEEEWQSDVDAARSIATTTLARIHEKPAFRADFDAARKDTAVRLKFGISPTLCEQEKLALASR